MLPLRLAGFMWSAVVAANSCSRGEFAAFAPGGFHWVGDGGSKFLLPGRVCCLCAWWVSCGRRWWQQIPAPGASLLPLRLAGFIGSAMVAANSCSRGEFAAFAPGGFHVVGDGGSKFLLPGRDCCLCAWWVSLGRRWWQQIPAPGASLPPLRLVGFIGSAMVAANSCSRGEFAAFAPGGFHVVGDGGSKFLLPGRVCCLCAWWVSKRKDRNCRPKFGRQFLSSSPGCYLPQNIRILDLLILCEQQDL